MASKTRATLGFYCLPREVKSIAELYGAARMGGRIVVHHPRQGGKRSAQVAIVSVYLQNRFWRHGLKWGLIGWAIGFAMAIWFFCPRPAHAADSGWADEAAPADAAPLEDPELESDGHKYDFSKSRFGTEHLTTDLCDSVCAQAGDIVAILNATAFIEADMPRVDGQATAELMVQAIKDYPLVPLDYALEIIARESSFLPEARNPKSGAYGYWQLIAHWHRKRMESMGWDWHNPEHNYRYGLWLITAGLNRAGITEPEQVTPLALYKATWYWEVRPAAYAAWRARE